MSVSPTITEPPRQSPVAAQSSFVIGQDLTGYWVAVETHGLGGGLFRSREDAVHYALAETLHRPDAISLATGPVEFRI